jgi:hypothetical protein
MSWIGFWAFFLFASLAVYSVMVLVVGVRALADIRRLFGLDRDPPGPTQGA